MKEYPSIPGSKSIQTYVGQSMYAFYKYDGSNLRFEWSKKKGWYKSGTRSRMFGRDDPDFGVALDILKRDWEEPLNKIFKDNKRYRNIDHITMFSEFVGPNSFAGKHEKTDYDNNLIKLVPFDFNLYKQGFLAPKDFIEDFDSLPVAQLIYSGKLTNEFIEDVRTGKYPVVEGVVCKYRNKHDSWMAKIKTYAYLEKLKSVFHENYLQYAE